VTAAAAPIRAAARLLVMKRDILFPPVDVVTARLLVMKRNILFSLQLM
jgi:hypothetical protein